MNRTNSTPSLLDEVSEAAVPESTEAFKQLASEKRLSILLALWESYEPFEEDHAVPFSVLRKRVGMRDKGQFHYHLDKLEGHFVRKADRGYELRQAGQLLVRAVIAGTGINQPSFDQAEIERPCFQCGASTELAYHDELLYWICTECDGLFGNHERGSEGVLGVALVDPAAFRDRRPEELLNTAFVKMDWSLQFAIEGVCDMCSGPMDRWLDICDDHASEGVCPTCERREAAIARFRCPVCKHHLSMVPWWLVIGHPAVVAFYYDHGVPLQYEGAVDGEFHPRVESTLPANHEQELVSMDPIRVRVTVRYEGEELQLTLDGELDVVDARRRHDGTEAAQYETLEPSTSQRPIDR